MILISRRKTSPGTSLIGEAVNKVTCSRTRPAGFSGRGASSGRVSCAGVSRSTPGRFPQGSGDPVSAFFGMATFSKGGIALARSLPPLPSIFFLGLPPRISALSSSSFPPKWRVPLPFQVSPGTHTPTPTPASQPQVQHAVRVTHHLLAPGYFTHQRGHGWMGIAQRSPLEATCRGHPGAFRQPDSSI